MPRLNLTILALVVCALTACEHNPSSTALTPTPGRPLRAEKPDATFRLTDAQRGKMLSMYDAEAVERLLQMVRPDVRESMLRYFQVAEKPGPHAVLLHLEDPKLQAVLEEVWARYWDRLPPEAIERERAPIPGRAIARARRAARGAAGNSESHRP
jgi:hypothetical protein